MMHKPKQSLREFTEIVISQAAEDNKASASQTVQQFVDHLRRVRGRSEATAKAYDSLLTMWVHHLDGAPIFEATKRDMEAFIGRPRMRRGRGTNGAPASRKRDADILRSFYRWAHEEGLVGTFLASALHGPTVHNRNPRPLSDGVWEAVWASSLPDHDRVLMGLGFFLGLRRAELATLEPYQVGDQMISNFIRKGGGEHSLDWNAVLSIYEARLPQLVAGTSLRQALERVRHSRCDAKFLLPYDGGGDRITKRVLAIARLADVPSFSPHALRHSAATNLLRAGVPIHLVREILNHSSIDITTRYVRAGGAQLREWLDSTDS